MNYIVPFHIYYRLNLLKRTKSPIEMLNACFRLLCLRKYKHKNGLFISELYSAHSLEVKLISASKGTNRKLNLPNFGNGISSTLNANGYVAMIWSPEIASFTLRFISCLTPLTILAVECLVILYQPFYCFIIYFCK
jgi:hypothetical protein